MYTDLFLIWWPSFLSGTSSEVSQGKWPESGVKSKKCMHYLCPRSVVNSKRGSWKKGLASYQNAVLKLSLSCRRKFKKKVISVFIVNRLLGAALTADKLCNCWTNSADTLGIKSLPKWYFLKSVPCSNIPLLGLCFHRSAGALGPGPCEPVEKVLTRTSVGLQAAQAHQRGTLPRRWWQGCGQAAALPGSHTHTLCASAWALTGPRQQALSKGVGMVLWHWPCLELSQWAVGLAASPHQELCPWIYPVKLLTATSSWL